jgi:hypothetical protein
MSLQAHHHQKSDILISILSEYRFFMFTYISFLFPRVRYDFMQKGASMQLPAAPSVPLPLPDLCPMW